MLPSVQLPSSNTIWCQFDLEKTSSVHCTSGHLFLLLHSLLYCECLSAYDSVIKLGQEGKKNLSEQPRKWTYLVFKYIFSVKSAPHAGLFSSYGFAQFVQAMNSWIHTRDRGAETRGKELKLEKETVQASTQAFVKPCRPSDTQLCWYRKNIVKKTETGNIY